MATESGVVVAVVSSVTGRRQVCVEVVADLVMDTLTLPRLVYSDLVTIVLRVEGIVWQEGEGKTIVAR